LIRPARRPRVPGSIGNTGATTVNGGSLVGGIANVFSAASATTVNTGGTLNLGGFAQTINAVSLTGGTLKNGSLTGAVSSAGGAINGLGGSATVTTTGGTTTLSRYFVPPCRAEFRRRSVQHRRRSRTQRERGPRYS
jgi:hypothetical protein